MYTMKVTHLHMGLLRIPMMHHFGFFTLTDKTHTTDNIPSYIILWSQNYSGTEQEKLYILHLQI